MKNYLKITAITALLATTLIGCTRVAPNEIGVLVENYGKDVTKDYSIVTGKVNTMAPGTDLYTLPIHEQRSEIEEPILNKSSDGTEFKVTPRYSYRIDPAQAATVVRQYSKIFKEEGTGANLKGVEKSALEPSITDVVRSVVESTTSEALMETGGNTAFNAKVRQRVTEEFKSRGFILLSFSTILEYSETVKASIDARNQANSEVSTLDSKILQAKKQKELADIQAETRKVTNQAITEQELKLKWIEKWDGKLPATSLGNTTPVIYSPK